MNENRSRTERESIENRTRTEREPNGERTENDTENDTENIPSELGTPQYFVILHFYFQKTCTIAKYSLLLWETIKKNLP